MISMIAYDDNSNDATQEVFKKFHSSHPNTLSRKLILLSPLPEKEGSGGAGYARNRCVEGGSGGVLVLMDSDDVMMKGRVEEQVNLLIGLTESGTHGNTLRSTINKLTLVIVVSLLTPFLSPFAPLPTPILLRP